MFGDVHFIPSPQCGRVVGDDVDPASDRPGLSGREPADAKVAVDAADHALEQFLVRLPGCSENELVVRTEAADQSVAGGVRVQGARVDVVARHPPRTARIGPATATPRRLRP